MRVSTSYNNTFLIKIQAYLYKQETELLYILREQKAD